MQLKVLKIGGWVRRMKGLRQERKKERRMDTGIIVIARGQGSGGGRRSQSGDKW